MTHEGHDTLSDGSLDVSLLVQHGGEVLGVALLCHQRGAYHHVQVEALHVGIGKVAVTVVHEVLYVCVADTSVLLAGDDLQRLDDHLLVVGQTDSRQPMLWVIVVLGIYVLTGAGIVDTDGTGEGEIDIPSAEVRLVVGYDLVEGVVSLLPGRAESHQQDDLVALLLGIHRLVDCLLILLVVRLRVIVVIVVATSRKRCTCDEGHHGQHQKLNFVELRSNFLTFGRTNKFALLSLNRNFHFL